jgi:hypothetical protein
MSNSIRIRTTPDGSDKYIKLKLDQEFDFIEILSLKLTQEEVYRKFSSDYGVIVGRVVVNRGVGVPNAKVSVFIPIDEIDSENTLIKNLYPYSKVTDKNNDGIRYNLLPNYVENDNECFTPIGTFPTKREILDNETLSKIYTKYYKFTTTTNYAGDFMIFGVPIGTYTVHVDADISNIGILSQKPYDLIGQGTPKKFFESSTKFKADTNLDKLPQVKTANIGVNVQPFWGDTENYEVGITRVDFDLNYTVTPSAIFIGSIFGDQAKHSVNKRCRPRQSVGELCEQVVGEGLINMIRKTSDGEIEEFDINGGELIDENGVWAYQIPMNLDYMVTDEDGQMVLSEDQTIGIPTRASVRFKIGMLETGGEGRLRTRAKFLVPNNPENKEDIDYNFDENTKDISFRNIYWNKIYTVSNFISRYQRRGSTSKNRNTLAIKNVDDCGDKTPFPYNRIYTEGSPIFFIFCLIIKIISFLVYFLNYFVLSLINFFINIVNFILGGIIDIINGIIEAINWILELPLIGGAFTFNTIEWNDIPFAPCISIPCPSDDNPYYYAPGCEKDSRAYESALEFDMIPNYYCGDKFGNTCSLANYTVGLDDCISIQLADGLNLYKFDFYNDWINGTLFSFLLKYKKKKKGREIFCEYDCSTFSNEPSYSGVDGNNNQIPDNGCLKAMLLDTCPSVFCQENEKNCQTERLDTGTIYDGLIKKYNDELFYASTTHDTKYKLFATDLICLGAVNNCDWQGFPKLQPFLVQTTYKLPPKTQEFGETQDGSEYVETSGMGKIGNSEGLFFSVNCLGLHTNRKQCLNLKQICEFSVDIDTSNETNNGDIIPADNNIGANEIDSTFANDSRNIFIWLNTVNPPLISDINSNFNINNEDYYNFTDVTKNGTDYLTFRYGETPSDFTNTYNSTKHSLYMYFGLLPGKTALDKLNQNYFSICKPIVKTNMVIEATSTPVNFTNIYSGTINFTVTNGFLPYNYIVNGPNNYSVNGTIDVNTTQPILLTGLVSGLYTISVTDSYGELVTTNVVVGEPISLYCDALVLSNATSQSSNDGKIKLSNLGGGQSPYLLTLLKDNLPVINYNNIQINTQNIPYVLENLSYGEYTLSIIDSIGVECITTGLTINTTSQLNITTNVINPSCANKNDGQITINVNGGTSPYEYNITGPASYTSQNRILNNLNNGSYTIVVTDINNITITTTVTLSPQNGPLEITFNQINGTGIFLQKQCSSFYYVLRFRVVSGIALNSPFYIEYKRSDVISYEQPNIQLNPSPFSISNYSNIVELKIPKDDLSSTSTIKVKISNTQDFTGCTSNILTIYKSSLGNLPTDELSLSRENNANQQILIVTGGIGNTANNYTLTNANGVTYPLTYNPTLNRYETIGLSVGYIGTFTITDSVGCTKTVTFS